MRGIQRDAGISNSLITAGAAVLCIGFVAIILFCRTDLKSMVIIVEYILFAIAILLFIAGIRISFSLPGRMNALLQENDEERDDGISGYFHEDLQESLEMSSRKLARSHIIMENAPFACMVWSMDRVLIECNTIALTLFKVNSIAELEVLFFNFDPVEMHNGIRLRSIFDIATNTSFSNNHFTYQATFILPDDTLLPVEISLLSVTCDVDYLVIYAKDLREQKKEMDIMVRRDTLHDALNAMTAVLLKGEGDTFSSTLHQSMGVLAQAARADRMYLWRNHTVNGQLYYTRYEWLDGVQLLDDEIPRAYSEYLPEFTAILLRGEAVSKLVSYAPPVERSKMGAQGMLAVLLVPVFIREEFWGVIGFANCHSEELFSATEEYILRSASLLLSHALLRNEFLQSLEDSSRQMEQALAAARNADSAKSDFLARMSHEMRTPLNAIVGFSELTLASGNLEPETVKSLEKIYGAGLTLLSLINDILDFSKIEAGKLYICCAEYHVPTLINDVVAQNILRKGEDVGFILNIDADLPVSLYGDELRIKQVINNLLSNAFKFTHRGAVKLSIHSEREEDRVWVTLRVSDSGIGIRSGDLDKLFDDYVQVDRMNHQNVTGTGLGLPITKRLVEMMDGEISVASQYGVGSIFTVRFPQQFTSCEEIGSQVAKSLRNLQYAGNKRAEYAQQAYRKLPYAKILVVDDNITNIDVIKGFLRCYGMPVDSATSGQEAIDAVREEKVRYDAIFMDHMMPEMDGIEAVRRIREIDTEYARTVPVIALTANAIKGNAEIFLSRGFQEYMTKPIDRAHLDAVLRRFIPDVEGVSDDGPQAAVERRAEEERARYRTAVPQTDLRSFASEMEGLDLVKGLEHFGDEASFMFVLRSYAVNTKVLLEALGEVGADTLAGYAITVHGIKGASRGIYAEPAGAQAEALEQAAKNGDIDYVIRNNPRFQSSVRKLIEDIELMLDAMEKANPKPVRDKPDMDALTRLCAACDRYDMDGIDAAMAEIEAFTYESCPEFAYWLKEVVNQMDFELIREKIVPMINSQDMVENGNG